jgi:hypothetical protein
MPRHVTMRRPVVRIQTGVRLEKRLVQVLKGLAEYLDISLSELLELIVLHAFEGTPSFSMGTRRRIGALKRVYDFDYDLEQARMILFVERK